MSKLVIKVKKPKAEDLLFYFFFTFPVWQQLFFSRLSYTLSMVLPHALMLVLYLGFAIKKKDYFYKYLDVTFVYLGIFILFFAKFFLDDSMSTWLSQQVYSVRYMLTPGMGIFAYAVVRTQENPQEMLKKLKVVGVILALFYAYQLLPVLSSGYWEYMQFGVLLQQPSNMSWGYGVLMTICFLSIFVLYDKKRLFLIPIALGALGALIYGSRGAIIVLAVGILLLMLFYGNNKLSWKRIILLIFFFSAIIFILSDTGLDLIANALNSMGVSSRFVETLQGSLTFDSVANGRENVWPAVIQMIQENLFFGYGVFGERNVVYALGYKWGYCHNLILEILIDFGCVVGGALVIFGGYKLIKNLITVKDKAWKLLFIIFVTLSVELVMSNSIWFHTGFWSLIAIFVNYYKQCSNQANIINTHLQTLDM